MYQRPAIDPVLLRDEAGAVIDYGNRWGEHGPPDEAYSVDAHPERFAPLHEVAEALIAHLVDTYEVAVVDDAGVADDLLRPVRAVLRAVRLVPTDTSCASLTMVLTAYPGVVVHAGLLHDFWFPECGCEACDQTWQAQADELEKSVLAVVDGGYREWVRGRFRPVVGMELGRDGASSLSYRRADGIDRARLAQARRVLSGLPDCTWAPWHPCAQSDPPQ